MNEEIISFNNLKHNTPIYVEISGISHCDGSYEIRRTNSRVCVIEFVQKGRGYIETENETLCAKEGDFYILPSGIPHHYYSSADDPMKKIFINLGGSLAHEIPMAYGITKCTVYPDAGNHIKSIFDEIKSLVRRKNVNLEVEHKLISLFFQSVTRLFLKKYPTEKNQDALKLKQYLDNNTNRIVKNEELANRIFRSCDYCVKLFKREFNETPYNYHLKIKMEIAVHFLRNTSISVKEIAERLGYFDEKHFSSLFKRKMGLSPMNFRKEFSRK